MKTIFLITLLTITVCWSGDALAQDQKISTSLFLRHNLNLEKTTASEQLYVYWSVQSLGVELDVQSAPEIDFTALKSSLTFKRGPVVLVGGVSTNSVGADHLNTGIWYANSFQGFSVFYDGRIYWGMNNAASDYGDHFLSIRKGLGEQKKLFAGLDLVFDHWIGESHSWYLVGPLVGYRVNDTISFLARFSRDWDVADRNTTPTDRVRVEVGVHF